MSHLSAALPPLFFGTLSIFAFVARCSAATINTDYAVFQNQFFAFSEQIDTRISGETADPDRDGLSNLLEYGLRLDPKTADSGSPVVLTEDNGYSVITFLRRKDAIDLGYTVEVSANLTVWNAGPDFTAEIAVTPIDDQADWVTVRDLTPHSAAGRHFIRLRIAQVTRLAIKTDPQATPLTRIFYANLQALQDLDVVAFGQQFSTWRGIEENGAGNWMGDLDRSDIQSVTGSHPAVTGWNFATYLNLSPSSRNDFAQRIIDDYTRNTIVTIHWPMNNIINGEDNNDTTGMYATPSILALAVTPGEDANHNLLVNLDTFATFLDLLHKDDVPIPIIFRPFHEMNGGFHWWGTGGNHKMQEYVAMWKYVLSYLRDTKGIHQLIYAYAPAGNQLTLGTTEEYLENWPGDTWVDICGVDLYTKDSDPSTWNEKMQTTYEVAAERSMPAAFTELGRKDGLYGTPNNAWWTSRVLADFDLGSNPLWTKCAYMLTWTQQGSTSFFIPYPGHPQTEDFKTFVNDPHVMLQNKLPPMYRIW